MVAIRATSPHLIFFVAQKQTSGLRFKQNKIKKTAKKQSYEKNGQKERKIMPQANRDKIKIAKAKTATINK